MDVIFEKMLQDSNQIKNHIESNIPPLDSDLLNEKTDPKQWSIIEVIEHLNKVYDKYLDLFEKAIAGAPDQLENASLKRQNTLLGRLSTYAMRPKNNKRRFKMKTFDFFTPKDVSDQKEEVLEVFFRNKEKFNTLIKRSRTKDLHNIKMPTSLGDRVKFYVPECFEFILMHEKRHIVQIEEILKNRG